MRPAFLSALFVGVSQFFSAAAAAQEAEEDTVAPIPLDPVVVSVLRTPLEVSRAPFAVSVNTEAEIQRARPGLGLDEALFGIAGVQVDNRYNYALGERISIRGFGARAQFGVRGIKVMVDGIPATFPDGQSALGNVDLGSLGRAEVIRGPAAALYGNAAGGVIQLETEAPPPVPLSQEITATAGDHGLLRIQSTTAGTSGPTSYLLSLTRLDYDGYRQFHEAENLHANARLTHSRGPSDWSLVANFATYDAQNPGSLSRELLQEDRAQAYQNNVRQRTGEEGRQGQLGLTWRREVGGGETELSGYGLGRSIVNPIPSDIIELDRAVGGVRAVYRSAGGPAAFGEATGGSTARVGSIGWSVGAEGDLQLDDRLNFANEEGEAGSLTLDQEERVISIATFAQLAARPTARLDVLAGLRYDRYRFSVVDRFDAVGDPDDSGARTMDALSPSLGATFAAHRAASVYANVATSFETPTTTELVNRPSGAGGFNPDLDPQRTLSFEAGAKGRIGVGSSYQLAAYRATVENTLIPFEVPDVPGRQFFRNAGSAVHQGIEAELGWRTRSGPGARVAYTYTDARFEDYEAGGVDHGGNRIPGIAPHHLEATVTYQPPSSWFAALEARYGSRMPVNDENADHSPSYSVVNVRGGTASLELGGMRIAPFAGVNNAFDELYNTSVIVNAFGGRYYEPGPGRSLYAGATLRFGR